MKIHASTACWPGHRFMDAVTRLYQGTTEPLLGTLSIEHIQLCPQNHGKLDRSVADELMEWFPESRFRLHANVRVFDKHPEATVAGFSATTRHEFERLAEISRQLNAPCYTLHAGRRQVGQSFDDLLGNLDAIEDIFGVPVGIEGHYPDRDNPWWLSDWNEHEALLRSGRRFVVDLSHFNIIARRTRARPLDLIGEMLASPNCLEIHLSGNDGLADRHQTLDVAPWWFGLLPRANPSATLFSEGNQILATHKAA